MYNEFDETILMEEQLGKESYFIALDIVYEILSKADIDIENINKKTLFIINSLIYLLTEYEYAQGLYQHNLTDSLDSVSIVNAYKNNVKDFYSTRNIDTIKKYFLS